MGQLALAAALVLVSLALRPAGASAVPLHLGLEGGTVVVGEVTLVDIVQGVPDGAIVDDPTAIEPPLPDWVGSVVFQVTMTGPQTLGLIGLLYFLHENYVIPTGGWIPGAVEPDGLVDGRPTPFTSGVNGAEFPTGLTTGQTSNQIFVLVDLRELPQRIPVLGALRSPSGFANAVLPIPEPGTAVALGTGIGLIAALRARQRGTAT